LIRIKLATEEQTSQVVKTPSTDKTSIAPQQIARTKKSPATPEHLDKNMLKKTME